MQDGEPHGAGEGGGKGGKPVLQELLRLSTDPHCSLRGPALALLEGSPWPEVDIPRLSPGLRSPTFYEA